MDRQRLNILLIAGDYDCSDTVTAALRSSQTRCRLLVIPQDRKALPCLRREGRFADAPEVDLVLFDAQDTDSQDVALLQSIRTDRALGSLPVVLLTGRNPAPALEEMLTADSPYTAFSPVDLDSFLSSLNAIDPARFMRAISLLENFGFVVVRMPEPACAHVPQPAESCRRMARPGNVLASASASRPGTSARNSLELVHRDHS